MRTTLPWPKELQDQVRTLIAAGKSPAVVAQQIGKSRPAVVRGALKYGLGAFTAPPGRDRIPIPEDFAALWPTMEIKQLAARYGVGATTAFNWGQRLNLGPRRGVFTVSKSGARPKSERPRITKPNAYRTTPVDRFNRDTSRAGEAADYLRRFGPVVRCDARGQYSPNGNHWRRGSTILSADDVIARARRNGWNPEAWLAVA